MKFIYFLSKHWAWTLLVVLAGALLFWVTKPTPIPVDTAVASRSTLQLSIRDSGVTRVKNLYQVAAPLSGMLERTTIQTGDFVTQDTTIIATLHQTPAPFIDSRTRQELMASRAAAEASVRLARAEQEKVNSSVTSTKLDYDRATRMIVSDVISQSELEHFSSAYKSAKATYKSASANVELRMAELERIDALLSNQDDVDDVDCCIDLFAPITGRVLSIRERSAKPIPAGTIVAEIGDTKDLEIVSELTTQDTVKLQPNMSVEVTNWGGEETLSGTVMRIEPAAFPKISALGIEEQRVKVVISLDQSVDSLGHGFHVDISILTSEDEDQLLVPIGALFRYQGEWAVFILGDNNKAILTPLNIGKMNTRFAQVISGINEGQSLILYPSDKLSEGTLVSPNQVHLSN